MEIIFASQNQNKIREISALMPEHIHIVGLDSVGNPVFKEELPETGDTLEANALQKARFVFEHTGKACFADDTGLEIYCLGNRPGVYSARYAGEAKNADENIAKILSEMNNCENRSARFRTVIAFVNGEKEHLFEGVVEGEILKDKRGSNGFGYDPVFVPEGFSKAFAEMELAEKNSVSHRARALVKLVGFLQKS
ncbi:MAG: RdgB/HAM1 family non-canonical purine NTP pyrophosphatase [Bacteroidota bacterium]|nr:RdgB/HAM1 family non-canonical purine NTP pyrophosphatase [Bacteroidota bacterium]